MRNDGFENLCYFTRLSMIWAQMTCLWVSAPTRSVRGDLCALLWFYTGYVCLCFEKGGMSSCWKYASFCGYFSFHSRLSFWLFFRGSFVLNDFAFPDKYSTLPRLFCFFSSNNQMNVLLFLPWLPNDLHLWMSNDCTGGRGLLEKIIFKHMGIIIRKRNCYAWNEQRQL